MTYRFYTIDQQGGGMFRLDGKTALISGASRGLGWGMAKALAKQGAHVF